MKPAYRRFSLRSDIDAMCVTHLDNREILNLRQTFGQSFGPYLFFRLVSNPSTNLSNDMLTHIE